MIYVLSPFQTHFFFPSFCHCTVASREQLVAHFSQLHSQDHLADHDGVNQVDEVAREEVVKDEQEDLQPEVAREEIVEYDDGGGGQECESTGGVEVILIDQEMRNQGILIIEEPVVYC